MVIGDLGSGKTALATYLLIYSKYETKYSNYPVNTTLISYCRIRTKLEITPLYFFIAPYLT
ncbi:hypothetical protein [Spiroplasma kunkelii]|nr:hypothetical protein [Spiroplasma kunkelii]